jgi:hydrogenase/urease accessory protein HupE
MRRLAGLCLLLLAAGFAGQPAAHELQPSSFELRQLTPERYEIIWRAPTYSRKPHPARLQLPDNWQPAGAAKVTRLADGALHRRLVDIPPDSVDGAIIRFAGLEATITDAWQVAWDYTLLGMDHILSGFDHLTFVLALLLIVSGARRLLITITSFTLAHSITLAAATLGVLWVPGAPVEATIALSILFLASELVKVNRGQPSLTASYPWIVAFVFGLLHGFGFAGALGDIGLPQNEIPLALLMFNIGVELGQLLFVAFILAIVMILNRLRREWPAWTRQIPAYGIGGIAAFWLIERIAGF